MPVAAAAPPLTTPARPGAAPPTPAVGGAPVPGRKGFVASLFDIGFTAFITRKLISVSYVLAILGIVVAYLLALVSTLNRNTATGLAVLVIGPFVGLLVLISIRVWLEFVAVIFSQYESTRRIEGILERSRNAD